MDRLTRKVDVKSETTAVKQACEKCGDEVDHFSVDPGLWPVWLCGPGSNGVAKVYHQKCVSVSIGEVDYLRSHVTKIDEENATLRTQLKSVEAERDEANAKLDHTLTANEPGTTQYWIQEHDKLAVALAQMLLRLQEAEGLIRNAGEPSWRLGYTESNDWLTRRHAFLNPKPFTKLDQ